MSAAPPSVLAVPTTNTPATRDASVPLFEGGAEVESNQISVI